MAFHCGAPTRDGSPCQRHVREPGIRCAQHRNLGGTALHPSRPAMRTIELTDPALTAARTAWTYARADLASRAGEPRDRVTPTAEQESPHAPAGTQPTEGGGSDVGIRATATGPIGPQSYLDRERSRRMRAEADDEREAAGAAAAGGAQADAGAEPGREAGQILGDATADAGAEPGREAGQMLGGATADAGAKQKREAEQERGDAQPEADRPSALLSYLDRERTRRLQAERERSDAEAEPEPVESEPLSALTYIARQRAARIQPAGFEPEESAAELVHFSGSDQASEPDQSPGPDRSSEPKPRPVEQRPQLRKERALDPNWIAARPLFRDEAPTRPLPKIEFEPSEGRPPRRPPRVPPMRSVVLNPATEAPKTSKPSEPSRPAVTPNGFAAEPDLPTLIDRMPPIDHDDLVVPEFLRPDFGAPAAAPQPRDTPPPLPQRTPRPWPIPKGPRKPKADPDPPTLIDPHPPIAAAAPAAGSVTSAGPIAPAAAPVPPVVTPAAAPVPHAAAPARPAAPTAPLRPAATTAPAAPAATATAAGLAAAAHAGLSAPDDIAVPDFIVPGFAQPAGKPPLRTVLSTVLGPDLWQRCYVEWSPAHCAALARIARTVDGLAPSAGTAVRSTAGAGMRWLGVAREREMLADEVAAAISHPVGATAPNQARTVRLYGAAICMALNVPLRRCACHRDLERDVSSELIRLGLEELAGEVT